MSEMRSYTSGEDLHAKNIIAKLTKVASELIVDFKNIDYYSKPNQEEEINNIIYK